MNDMNERREEETALTMSDLFGLLWRRLWIILLAAAIVAGAVFAYNYTTYTEEYTSTAKIYVLNTEVMDGASASTTAYYFQLSLTILKDCEELLLSDTVMERAADELGLQVAPSVLRSMIKVQSEEESRILKLSVTTGNPELSCVIANAVSEHGATRIAEVMNVNQIKVYEHATVSRIPSNDVGWQLPALFGFVAGALVYAICLVVMLLDDKVNDVDDAEIYLGLTVLGNIPHASGEVSKKNARRMYGKYYGKYISSSGRK
jgi:capsular polysaccharide biosynthesis protein